MIVHRSTTVAELGREALLAIRAVEQAVGLARTLHAHALAPALTKADASPVTVADFAIQAVITARLARDFPSDAVVAEEDASGLHAGATPLCEQITQVVRRAIPDAQTKQVLDWIDLGAGRTGPRFWTLDPIDGTKGLLHGRQYAVALALIVDGSVRLGVVGCPRLSITTIVETSGHDATPADGGIAVAVRGCGAWWRSATGDRLAQLAVSARADPSSARVLRSHESQHGDMERFSHVLTALGSTMPPVLMDSQAKHVALAAGAGDLLMRFPPQREFHDAIWDCAAGTLLIEEAGGRVTDMGGRTLDFTAGRRLLRNEGLLASNGLLHEAALTVIRRAA